MTHSVERLALRCLLPGFVGTEAPDWVLRSAAEGLGGVCLYGRNVDVARRSWPRCAGSCTPRTRGWSSPSTRRAATSPGSRRATGSSYPGNLALGAAGDVDADARGGARDRRSSLRDAGVDLDLAPVADVNSNPSNPVIGVRSFGSEPGAVAAPDRGVGRGSAERRGGRVRQALPRPRRHIGRLAPRAAGRRRPTRAPARCSRSRRRSPPGVQAVMSAHILVPSLDRVPATVSRRDHDRPAARRAWVRRPRP